jgi:hypothetical protein
MQWARRFTVNTIFPYIHSPARQPLPMYTLTHTQAHARTHFCPCMSDGVIRFVNATCSLTRGSHVVPNKHTPFYAPHKPLFIFPSISLRTAKPPKCFQCPFQSLVATKLFFTSRSDKIRFYCVSFGDGTPKVTGCGKCLRKQLCNVNHKHVLFKFNVHTVHIRRIRRNQKYPLIVPLLYSTCWVLHVSTVACHHQGAYWILLSYVKYKRRGGIYIYHPSVSTRKTTFTECTQLAAQLYPTAASNTSAAHHMR